jgi:hypothetical protein
MLEFHTGSHPDRRAGRVTGCAVQCRRRPIPATGARPGYATIRIQAVLVHAAGSAGATRDLGTAAERRRRRRVGVAVV